MLHATRVLPTGVLTAAAAVLRVGVFGSPAAGVLRRSTVLRVRVFGSPAAGVRGGTVTGAGAGAGARRIRMMGSCAGRRIGQSLRMRVRRFERLRDVGWRQRTTDLGIVTHLVPTFRPAHHSGETPVP